MSSTSDEIFVVPVRADHVVLSNGSEKQISQYNSYTALKDKPSLYLHTEGKAYDVALLQDVIKIDEIEVEYDKDRNLLKAKKEIPSHRYNLPQIGETYTVISSGSEIEIKDIHLFFKDNTKNDVLMVQDADDNWFEVTDLDIKNKPEFSEYYREYL
jgi:hypothetical protein